MIAKKGQTFIASSHFNSFFLYSETTVTINTCHETVHYKPLKPGRVVTVGTGGPTSVKAFTPSALYFSFPPAMSMHDTDTRNKNSPAAVTEGEA